MAGKLKVDVLETVDATGTITINNDIAMASTKTLPAASLTGALPAISAANLTAIPAANITGTLPAISGANLTGIQGMEIVGGTKNTYSGYESRTFLDGGSFYLPTAKTVDFILLGGGGGGGNHTTTNANGGGGAGGMVLATGYSLAAGSYHVKIGKGGQGYRPGNQGRGHRGEDSQFAGFVAHGGGGGGATGRTTQGDGAQGDHMPSCHGGCGGGKAQGADDDTKGTTTQPTYSGTANVTGVGYDGGLTTTSWQGSGGGGVGAAGTNGSPTRGNGGIGVANVYETGSAKYIGGGGGGGGNSSENSGDGYYGGGRGCGTTAQYHHQTFPYGVTNSTTYGSAQPDAIPNTGGGGGAGSYWFSTYWGWGGGNGGSGYFCIRWAV